MTSGFGARWGDAGNIMNASLEVAGLQGPMSYLDRNVQCTSFGGLKFWRSIKARTRLQNHICTEAMADIVRVNEVTEGR